ncbi:2-dehydropantoate 2-reductase [Marinobacter halodurans]|uniref:2-dehydropantoate 2-reductase n=1 Tax=Marinobacter halodurans TaxID=2528979 RepID=A0ABY1ZEF8_9GAMM|nr:2-dehydropantoate 2-reductase [Marinobacter halodurans]TBW48495.1 2-dehydropantoate 2-reductase [Marinobacter halodurans]
MSKPPRIAIFGAGSVGCYLGGRLLAAGADVVMIGRDRLASLFRNQPLRVSDYRGVDSSLTLTDGQYTTDPAAVAGADLVLLTVKSAATEDAGQALAPHLAPGTAVISLQNGISNADRLKPLLPEPVVLSGMVPFNVLQHSPGHFHQGTEGDLMAAQHSAITPAMEDAFARAGLPLIQQSDMRSVLWSKLLLNLNNPINALSGLPLKAELSQRAYRLSLAMAQRETLALLRAAGIPTVKLAAVPMPLVPWVMALPDWLFRRLAQAMLSIDPLARSSMWEDLQAGRRTEVDWINGEVVQLARRLVRPAPVNECLVELIREAEAGTLRNLSGEDLLEKLNTASRQG